MIYISTCSEYILRCSTSRLPRQQCQRPKLAGLQTFCSHSWQYANELLTIVQADDNCHENSWQKIRKTHPDRLLILCWQRPCHASILLWVYHDPDIAITRHQQPTMANLQLPSSRSPLSDQGQYSQANHISPTRSGKNKGPLQRFRRWGGTRSWKCTVMVSAASSGPPDVLRA